MAEKHEEQEPIQNSSIAWHLHGRSLEASEPEPIWALGMERAGREFARALAMEKVAYTEPDLVCLIRKEDKASVRAFLDRLPPNAEEAVVAAWNETDVALLTWGAFVRNWWRFCYPSSDELTVVPLQGDWVLYWTISCELRWKADQSPRPTPTARL